MKLSLAPEYSKGRIMAAKIRRDDEVIVLTGKDKVSAVKLRMSVASGRVIVRISAPDLKHQKPVPALNQPGGIVEKRNSGF